MAPNSLVADKSVAKLVLFSASLLAVAWILERLIRGYRNRKYYSKLPGPPHSMLWGHLKVLGEIAAMMPPNTHPQAYFTEIARKYQLEGMFYLDLWPVALPSVILCDPELSDEVTVLRPLPMHSVAAEFIDPIAGPNTIAVANGPMWKRLHHAISPAFSLSHIRNLTDLMVEECTIFHQKMAKLADSGEVFSMEALSARLIFDVIGRIVFSTSLNAQTTDSDFLRALTGLIGFAHGELDVAAKYNPVSRVKSIWKKRQIESKVNPRLLSKIHERFNLLQSENHIPSRTNPSSILDLMLRDFLEKPEEGSTASAKMRKSGLRPDEIKLLLTNIKILLLGGHGTTTDTICYVFMLLSNAPEVVKRMREEHDKVFGTNPSRVAAFLAEEPNKLQELPYTEGVIKETLRMFNVGMPVRGTDNTIMLNSNGQSLPVTPNMVVTLNTHDIHYNPDYYSRPTEFLPERWIDAENEIPRSSFRTFGRGPRTCLGQNLALTELKVILAMTMRDYEFTCHRLKPNPQPKTRHTNLDTVFGDIIFQELGMEARPRGGMMMTAKKLRNV